MISIEEAQEISGIGYWELDFVNDELRWSNQVYTIFGVSPENFKPTDDSFYSLVHPDDRAKIRATFDKAIAEKTPYEVQHRIIVNGDEIRYVVERCGTIFDKDGKPLKSIGSVQDVTESVEAKMHLEASHKKFMAISNQTTEGITVADLEGNYVFVNPAFCKMSGYTQDELLKLTVFDMKAPNQDHSSFKNTKEEMEGLPVRVILQKKTGEEYYTEIIGDVIDVDGESLVLGTIRDVTEKVKQEEIINKLNAELESKVKERTNQLNETIKDLSVEVEHRKKVESELKDSLAIKDVLFREITHRVKNNMQIISSLINLQKTNLDAEAGEFLEQISRRIHAMALIHETLYKTNDFKFIQYDYYLESLIKYIRESYDVVNVSIQLEAQKSTLPLEVGTSLGMIVIELVINSIKHAFDEDTENGIIEIKFSELENSQYQLSICDNGKGMPSGFDIVQAKTLGLQLVSSLAEQISGEIEMRECETGGTRFEVNFKV